MRAQAELMEQMMAQLQAIVTGPTEEKRRWEKLFPGPAPGARVNSDPSLIYGDWKLDHAETAKVHTRLGEKISAATARKSWPNRPLRITRKALRYFEGDALFDEQRYRDWRRRGERFSLLLGGEAVWDFWCDGDLLVDDTGMAWRRAD